MPNLRLAARSLARAPFVTAVATISLALGIGANTAIFSMFKGLLLRPLPVPAAGELVNVSAPGPRDGAISCNDAGPCEETWSYPTFRDLERAENGLTGLAAHRLIPANLSYQGHTIDAEGVLVSGSYFSVLGLRPALGRLLGPSDDVAPGGHPVAVLSHEYWQGRLGADPAIVDKQLVVNGRSFTIVGVAPASFTGTTLGSRPRVFVPLTMQEQVLPGFGSLESRRYYWLYVFGRLAPGVPRARAEAALNTAYRPILADVEAPLQEGLSDDGMRRFLAKRVILAPGHRGQSSVDDEAGTPLLMLFAVTAIVLLIACINVANLFLARGADRSLEMAVRLSLGAGRRRLLAQLLTECVLLGIVAGLASLLVARWTIGLVISFLPPDAALAPEFRIDGAAMAFAGLVSLATGVAFGLAPALHATRPELVSVIKASTGRASDTRGALRFRGALVTAQMALSMALLVTAALFIRSLANAARVDLGLEPEHVVTFRVSPTLNGYEPGRSRVFFRRLEEELRAIPGVVSVAASRVPMLSGSSWSTDVAVEGFEATPEVNVNARYNQVGAGFITTFGMRLLAGRDFTEADDLGAPRVAIVNEAFARHFELGRNPLGKRMGLGATPDIEIVGLVRDAKYNSLKEPAPPVFFLPYRQDTTIGSVSFYVRTRAASTDVLGAIPPAVARIDPNLPVTDVGTFPQQIRENLFLDRMIGTFATAFAALATLLAAIGLYAVLAYSVAQRTREIGVRMALGADRGRVRALVLRQVAMMGAIGGLIGVAGAIGIGRAARSMLFEVQGHDPLAIGAAIVVLAAVAGAAGYLPARRASQVHPMEALRWE